MNISCPLCSTSSITLFSKDTRKGLKRDYYRCKDCDLIFVDRKHIISYEKEKARYDSHKNSPKDTGYRKFLSRLMNPMLKEIANGDTGLDFGCGPGPTLSLMFQDLGYSVSIYDPFYAPDKSALEKKYEFITASEVFEHFNNPEKEIDLLWSMLNPGGTLGIMTKLTTTVKSFQRWHYKNDETHICFYSDKTFEWISQRLNAKLSIIGDDVVLLSKEA